MKSIVLLSGGLDSAVNLGVAAAKTGVLLAITFDYGQRAAAREIAAAAAMCASSGVKHEVIELPWLRKITRTALVDRGRSIPEPGDDELDGGPAGEKAAGDVWVPNRNAVFVSIGAAFAEASGSDAVVAGFNAEEGVTFPDNSAGFVFAMNDLLAYSTLSKVKVVSYTSELDKKGIVELGLSLGAPLDRIWSCYGSGPRHCLRCESCRRLERAMRAAGAWESLEASL